MEPGGPQNDVFFTALGDAAFSLKLGVPINAKRCSRIVLAEGSFCAAPKDIVRRNMNQRDVALRTSLRYTLCSVGIDGVSELRFRFRLIYSRVSGSIDHDVGRKPVEGMKDCIGVEEVELGAPDGNHHHIAGLRNFEQ